METRIKGESGAERASVVSVRSIQYDIGSVSRAGTRRVARLERQQYLCKEVGSTISESTSTLF